MVGAVESTTVRVKGRGVGASVMVLVGKTQIVLVPTPKAVGFAAVDVKVGTPGFGANLYLTDGIGEPSASIY